MSKAATASKINKWVQSALDDAKARDITVLDVRQISDFTDYMIIATGTSNRHVQSTADKVVDHLRAQGVRAVGMEGEKTGDWVLIDFGDVVTHVMREQTRDFYNLEKLWSDAKQMQPVEAPKTPKAPKVRKSAKSKKTKINGQD